MTTIRALDGLVRRGTPLAGGGVAVPVSHWMGPWANVIGDGTGEYDPIRHRRLGEYGWDGVEVDLTDPTGFYHLLLWVCGKVGVNPSIGVIFDRGLIGWVVESGGRRLFVARVYAQANGIVEYTVVPTLEGITDPAEALKAIALHLDGEG